MSFLAPLFLLGALSIAAPFVFHLIRRTTRERTPFGSLMFLQPSPPRLTRRSRLEHLLLLALRCLALGLLAFAFARPFFRETVVEEGAAGQPARTVVLVDASASMRRAGLWAEARDRAERVLDTAGPADRVAVLTFARGTSTVVGFDEWSAAEPSARGALGRERLAAAAPGWEGTQLGGALATAAELLLDQQDETAAPGPRRIVLISDLQAGSRLDALQSFEWPQGVQLVLEPVVAPAAANASLQLIADAADADRGGEPAVRVRVTNAAESSREQFSVGWERPDGGGFAGAPAEVYVPPGQSRVVALPAGPESLGSTAIALRGDDEVFDNRVFVNPPEKRQVEVLYLGADTAEEMREPLFFLQRALTGTPRIDLQVVARDPSAPLAASDVAGAALLVVTDPLSAPAAETVRARIEAGATVVAAPKRPAFAPTLSVLAGRPGLALEEARPGSYAMLAEIDFRHPVFAPFADPRYSDFTKIHFWAYRRLSTEALPEHRVLGRFDSGDPALVEIPAGRGRLLVLTSGWTPADSQLAVSSKFVPLLYSILELGGGLPPAALTYVVGDGLPLPPADSGRIRVQGPDGPAVELPAGAARFDATAAPGLYRVQAGEGPAAAFAVNLDPAEARTTPLTRDELEALGVSLAGAPTDAAQAAGREVRLHGMETESRQKLWRWFIGAALLVLLLESGLAGLTARRAAPVGGAAS